MKLYTRTKIFNSFMLNVDKIHSIYVEESGNSDGIPVVCLHGGPGAPMGEGYKYFMNPKKYHIISFHQRGCGKSHPYGSLVRNTTKHLIADMEKIRNFLRIKKWIVEGGSWGATLATLYAIKHPNKVLGLILCGIGIFSAKNLMEPATRIMAPDIYDDWMTKKTEKETMKDYAVKLRSKNSVVKNKYMKRWQYEEKLFGFMDFPRIKTPKHKKGTKFLSKKDQYTLALLECHYYRNHAFVKDKYIYKNAHKLKNIPGFIIHGRFDIICSPENSYKLHKLWKKSKLMINDLSGHGVNDKGNAKALLKAYKYFEKKKHHAK